MRAITGNLKFTVNEEKTRISRGYALGRTYSAKTGQPPMGMLARGRWRRS